MPRLGRGKNTHTHTHTKRAGGPDPEFDVMGGHFMQPLAQIDYLIKPAQRPSLVD